MEKIISSISKNVKASILELDGLSQVVAAFSIYD